MKKSIFIFLIIFCISILTFSGCANPQTYSIEACDVYVGSTKLRGPQIRSIDGELTLSDPTVKKGVEVTMDYMGNHYHGKVDKDSGIEWDKAPELMADGTYSSCKIENYNKSSIKITFWYYLAEYDMSAKVIHYYN